MKPFSTENVPVLCYQKGTGTRSFPSEFSGEERTSSPLLFENLVTKKQLTELLGLSLSYVSLLMAEEGLPYFKLGRAVRFRVSEVAAWLQKRRRP